jgi:serine/threonine protein kinase
MKIAIGVSRGLKYLHENDIIHGRVKPSNILLNHDYKPLVLFLNLKIIKLTNYTMKRLFFRYLNKLVLFVDCNAYIL